MENKYLMSYRVYNKLRHGVPYLFRIQKNGQYLFYFGANHSPDPKNKQYVILYKFWEDFLKVTKAKNAVVMVEGGISSYISNRNKAIVTGAESAYMVHLAKLAKVPVICPEPSFKQQGQELLEYFSKDEIEYYFFARTVVQWHRLKNKPDFEKYANRFLSADKKDLKWKGYNFTIENMIGIHERMFKKKFKPTDKAFFREIISPNNKTRINKVAEVTSRIRDLFILNKLESYWKQKKNLFIVFGYSHAVMQQAAINKIVKL